MIKPVMSMVLPTSSWSVSSSPTHAAGEVVARLSDNDISATLGKHRPGYQELMAAATRVSSR
jgi:hypothetical protein